MQEVRKIPPVGVRLPEPLKAEIRERAAKNRRSMNSEIITILESAIGKISDETKRPEVAM